jgi:hypothetical protein
MTIKVLSCNFYNNKTGTGFIETRLKRLRNVNRADNPARRENNKTTPLRSPKHSVSQKRPQVNTSASYIFNEAECQ